MTASASATVVFSRAQYFSLRTAGAIGKFQRAVADILGAAYAGDDPLPEIAGEVQHEVGDAVHFGVGCFVSCGDG